MSKELLGFVISVGETFMKSIPISLGAGRRLYRACLLLVLQPGPALVAKARHRHRPLLLVLHPRLSPVISALACWSPAPRCCSALPPRMA